MVKSKYQKAQLNAGNRSPKSCTRSGRRYNQISSSLFDSELEFSDSDMSEPVIPPIMSEFAKPVEVPNPDPMASLLSDIHRPSASVAPVVSGLSPLTSMISSASPSWTDGQDLPANTILADPGSTQCVRPFAKPNTIPWTSLFGSLPNIAGDYDPIQFDIPDVLSGGDPPPEILNEAKSFWKDHIVGFFLDSKLPNFDLLAECRAVWRIHGQLRYTQVNGMYYMKFSSNQEKQRVLEATPAIIRGKPFIVTPWYASVDRARDQVLSIPVWAQFNNVPSALQPLIGLNWLACHIGKLKCFDSNTVARRNLVFARALIEVTPDKPLPTQLKVCIEDHPYFVDVTYKWIPDICCLCKSFGHVKEKCTATIDNIQIVKVPLPRAPPMIWVPKTKPVVVSTTSVDGNNIKDKVPTVGQSFDWNKSERILSHGNTGMKHNLNEGTFYIHVDQSDATRKLIYKVESEGLILAKDGDEGNNNELILNDSVWDRRLIYSESSPYYLYDLATHFAEAAQDVTPGDAVRG